MKFLILFTLILNLTQLSQQQAQLENNQDYIDYLKNSSGIYATDIPSCKDQGEFIQNITKSTCYLLSNPKPCTIDFKKFLDNGTITHHDLGRLVELGQACTEETRQANPEYHLKTLNFLLLKKQCTRKHLDKEDQFTCDDTKEQIKQTQKLLDAKKLQIPVVKMESNPKKPHTIYRSLKNQ